jgi:DNA-binding MarR family transcriptional regulator
MSQERGKRSELPSLPVLISPRELPLRTWTRLIRVREQMGRRLERLFAKHGLTSAQFDVLATLAHGDGIMQQELSERLLVTKGNVCGLIDRAEAAGWVERRADPEDRRANRIFLTPAGRERLKETVPDHEELVREILGPLGAAQLLDLHDVLDQIVRRLDA